jgi:phospholipid-binding lipoprotein MlaA
VPWDTLQAGWRNLALIMLLIGALLAGGCATAPAGISDYDPLEQLNRKVYSFNDGFDRHVMTPVANAYTRVTPRPVQTSVSKFYKNLTYPNVILNDFLQGKLGTGIRDTGRFVLNSTVGILGLFDPASHLGLAVHNEDAGQTLAVWGVRQGPYLMLPFAGPTTVRDAPDLVTMTMTNPLFYVVNPYITIPLALLGFIDYRVQASPSINLVRESALDPYLFVREGYLQHREFLIFDGHPPPHFYEDFGGNMENAPEEGTGTAQ